MGWTMNLPVRRLEMGLTAFDLRAGRCIVPAVLRVKYVFNSE